MKKYAFIIVFLVANFASSQNKKTYYYDVNHQEIPEELFHSKKRSGYGYDYIHSIYIEKDTCIIALLHTRFKYGKLKISQLDSLKIHLEELTTNKKILPKDFIVINYFECNDEEPCTSKRDYSYWSVYDNNYLKKLKKIIPFSQFWVFKTKEDFEGHSKKIKKVVDENGLIKSLFFQYYIPYGSFVIINPEGNYLAFYGEYGKSSVWEIAKEMTGKKRKK